MPDTAPPGRWTIAAMRERNRGLRAAAPRERHSDGETVVRFVDLVDLGDLESPFDGKVRPSFLFVLHSPELDADQKPKLLLFWFTSSLYEGGGDLSPSRHLSCLRGALGIPELTEAMLDVWGYEPPKMLGKLARVTVVPHDMENGRTVSKVASFAPPQDGDYAPSSDDYKRPKFIDEMSVDYEPQVPGIEDHANPFLGGPNEDQDEGETNPFTMHKEIETKPEERVEVDDDDPLPF